jgi:hypothetical protein
MRSEPASVRPAGRSRWLAHLGQQGPRWWGDHYEVQPDELIAELNGKGDYERITALLKRHRALKR